MSLAENSPFFFVVAKNPSFDFVKMNVTFASGMPLPASSMILPETWASPRHAATFSLGRNRRHASAARMLARRRHAERDDISRRRRSWNLVSCRDCTKKRPVPL